MRGRAVAAGTIDLWVWACDASAGRVKGYWRGAKKQNAGFAGKNRGPVSREADVLSRTGIRFFYLLVTGFGHGFGRFRYGYRSGPPVAAFPE